MDLTRATDYFVEKYLSHEAGSTDEHQLDCPFCMDHKKHLYFNIKKGLFNCFKCNQGGTVLELLAEMEGKPIHIIRAKFQIRDAMPAPMVKGSLEDAVSQVEALNHPKPTVDLTFAEVRLPSYYMPLFPANYRTQPFIDYLLGRGMSMEEMQAYQFGCCIGGLFINRVILPIYMDSKMVGYQGRDITKQHPKKTLNPYGFRRGRALFNYDMAAKYDEIVVAEGPFGAIRIGPHAVATLGKKVTDDQVRLLEPFKKVTFMLDDNAWVESVEAIQKFKNPNIFAVFLKEGQPDDYTRQQLQTMVDTAVHGHSMSALDAWLTSKLGG